MWQLLVNDLIILAAEPAYNDAYGELFRNESLKIRSRLTQFDYFYNVKNVDTDSLTLRCALKDVPEC